MPRGWVFRLPLPAAGRAASNRPGEPGARQGGGVCIALSLRLRKVACALKPRGFYPRHLMLGSLDAAPSPKGDGHEVFLRFPSVRS